MLAAITAFFEAIPAILSIYNLYLQARKRGWVRDLDDLSVQVKGAKTDEERMLLAKRLFNHRAS